LKLRPGGGSEATISHESRHSGASQMMVFAMFFLENETRMIHQKIVTFWNNLYDIPYMVYLPT